MRSTIDIALLVLCVLIIVWAVMSLSGCAKPPRENEDTPGNAHVAQVEAEYRLWKANELAKR